MPEVRSLCLFGSIPMHAKKTVVGAGKLLTLLSSGQDASTTKQSKIISPAGCLRLREKQDPRLLKEVGDLTATTYQN